MIKQLARKILSRLLPGKKMTAREAYDHWSSSYDLQPNNVLLAMDELLFNQLRQFLSFKDKIVVDIGCGTGRHWPVILKENPAEMIGYDISEGMLEQLKQKFPGARVHHLHSDQLAATPDLYGDVIISTLTLGYIRDLKTTFSEWSRVLKPGGHLLITDFHPDAMTKGGKRTFTLHKKRVEIVNYLHSIEEVQRYARLQGWQINEIKELAVDDPIKEFFVRHNLVDAFERNKGLHMIYGMHLTKRDAVIKP